MSSRKIIQKEEGEMRSKWLLNTELQRIPILVTVEEIIKMEGKKLFCPNCQEHRSLEVIQYKLVLYASCEKCSMVLLKAVKRGGRCLTKEEKEKKLLLFAKMCKKTSH